MFLKIVCLYVAVVCVTGAPPTDVVPLERQQPTVIPIVEQSEELEANGTYKFSYETGNGIKREETSYDKVLPRAKSDASSGDENDESNEIHVQQGSYSYTAPDGTLISVRYIADENGFRPIGDHLPKAPSIIVATSPSRISGRRSKTADNAESGSIPAAAVLAAPTAPATNKASKTLNAPVLESRIADTSSAVQTSSPSSESQESSTSPEAPSTTEGSSTAEPSASTPESASTTTEQSLTSEVTSTEKLTTSDAASTPQVSSEPSTSEASSEPSTSEASSEPSTSEASSEPSTSEASSEPSTSEASSEPSTSEASSEPSTSEASSEPSTSEASSEPSTSEASSEPSSPEEPASTPAAATPAASTPNDSPAESTSGSEVSTEAAATASA